MKAFFGAPLTDFPVGSAAAAAAAFSVAEASPDVAAILLTSFFNPSAIELFVRLDVNASTIDIVVVSVEAICGDGLRGAERRIGPTVGRVDGFSGEEFTIICIDSVCPLEGVIFAAAAAVVAATSIVEHVDVAVGRL